MSRPLDVLVIESGRGAGDEVARALDTAGHRVHRCHGEHGAGTPCRGVLDVDDCPVERGTDVAVVAAVGDGEGAPHVEQAVSCAIRAGVPVMEIGRSPALAPFEPWLAARVDGDAAAVGAVGSAARQGFATMEQRVLAMARPLLADLGLPADRARCAVERAGTGLHVRIDLPVEVDEATRQAVAVRALAALRDERRRHDSVNIDVHGSAYAGDGA
ncbi:MAG TPA: hypothetical protein VFZ79_16425 [Acidimicrobiales bacterium]